MDNVSSHTDPIRFGAFAVNLQAGELRKHGAKVKLQEQPFQILAALLERPGEVVTREELRKRIWQGDTFVDFEQSLATAVKKLRRALEDSADHPSLVETLPRRGYRFLAALEARDGNSKPIVAMLPFENLSGEKKFENFIDGLTEEMIARLGRLQPQRLGVISCASAVRYKDTDKDIDQIGTELGADYVVKGGVRCNGQRVRITAELIQVKDRTHLWADRYEGEPAYTPVFQSAIARHIARSLQIEAPASSRVSSEPVSSAIPEAHAAFLRGRYCLDKGTAEGVKNAIPYFQEATAQDPLYAAAHAALAASLDLADHFRVLAGVKAFPRAKAAATRALELDDALPEAHSALAFARHSFDWDWDGAGQAYQRAIALNSNFAAARHWHGFYLGMLGRVEEAIAELRRAQELNPLSIIIRTHLGLMLHWGGRYREAAEQVTQTLEMEPYFAAAHSTLALTLEQQGKYQETVGHLEKALEFSPGSPDHVGALGHAHAVFKKKAQARKALEQLHELAETRYVSAYDFAIVCVGLGEANQAFTWLEKALEERSFSMLMSLKADPRLAPLRSDRRFPELLRRIGLP